ncbi:MAG: glycosyltransferase family 4 protein [Thermoanaerobaculia bacterium]
MRVLSVAFPFAPVGPDAAGGAEQVLSTLDRALVAAGHRSVVIAQEGSRTAGELVPVPASRGTLDEALLRRIRTAVRCLVEGRLHEESFDLVHYHGLDFTEYLAPAGPPAVATLHLPPSWYPEEALVPREGLTLCCVSRAQRRALPRTAGEATVVRNGVDLELFRPAGRTEERGDHVLALGRICPEKGFHLALDAARAARRPMILAGAVFPYPEHRRYHREQILPRLDGRRRFLGAVGVERKPELLRRAQALLVPSLAPETSSLVAMESLACGTPVVAFPVGAVPEVVEDGRTGFLVSDAREMAAAISRVDGIDRDACRRAAETHFSAERMVRDYLDLYRRLAEGFPGLAAVASREAR